jgi:poly(A) polymerase
MLDEGVPEFMAYQDAANEVISRQVRIIAMPRYITTAMREVWGLQPKFNARTGSKPNRLLSHPRFRAAYDFLLLRAETGGVDPELAEWWTRYQNANENEQRKMTQPGRNNQRKSGSKRNYRKGGQNKPKESES